MKHTRGFGIVALLVVVAVLALGGAGYVAYNSSMKAGDAAEQEADMEGDRQANVTSASDIAWEFKTAEERDNIPYTNVFVTVNGKQHSVGSFQGSCSQVTANGGVDGTGLLAGELSAAQCWFAGGGDEIGVFATEDGGLDLMVGELGEPIEGSEGFRGNFKINTNVDLD